MADRIKQPDREKIISEKATIQFKKDTLSAIASLDTGACSEFINACLDYDNYGVIKTDFKHETAKALFILAKPQLDDAMEQYVKGRQQRINAIRARYNKG